MNTPILSWPGLRLLGHLPSALRLAVGLAAGAAAWLLTPAALGTVSRLVAAWDAFGVMTLLLLWAAIFSADIDRIRVVASKEDLSRSVSFIFVLVAAGASLLAVVALLHTLHSLPPAKLAWHIGLSMVAVGAAWLLVHTVFTLRYAHAYYDAGEDGTDVGGLDFPGHTPEPDYLDIAYFAFVVGMTAQTADVSISGRTLRRLALLHGLISFVFNTSLVALVISGLASVL
ncbi:DUF1345 domain-containing protein [Hymenobacter bucti]|uniref:DUF1345 domain-containing protein n=1 Tax=Hymenobacter bucti TaxID=1844114 RepID=A0ABW4QMN8_9BACT